MRPCLTGKKKELGVSHWGEGSPNSTQECSASMNQQGRRKAQKKKKKAHGYRERKDTIQRETAFEVDLKDAQISGPGRREERRTEEGKRKGPCNHHQWLPRERTAQMAGRLWLSISSPSALFCSHSF